MTGSTLQAYGASFRISKPDTHYWFAIDSNSKWAFFRVENSQLVRLQATSPTAPSMGGLHTKNTLSVDFRGQTFTFWVSGTRVGSLTDSGSSLGAGKVALEAGSGVTAVFTNFVDRR